MIAIKQLWYLNNSILLRGWFFFVLGRWIYPAQQWKIRRKDFWDPRQLSLSLPLVLSSSIYPRKELAILTGTIIKPRYEILAAEAPGQGFSAIQPPHTNFRLSPTRTHISIYTQKTALACVYIYIHEQRVRERETKTEGLPEREIKKSDGGAHGRSIRKPQRIAYFKAIAKRFSCPGGWWNRVSSDSAGVLPVKNDRKSERARVRGSLSPGSIGPIYIRV